MKLTSSANTSSANSIIDYDGGFLDDEETVEFFQTLIDSGRVWRMQGVYCRQAMGLIRSGQCMLGRVGYRDYYDNYIPSRDEVQPGTPGSPGYVQNPPTN